MFRPWRAEATGPALRPTPALTAAAVLRHSCGGSLPLLNARTAWQMGANVATAFGSSRHVGLSTPKTISAAERKPRQAAPRAARLSCSSSLAGALPQEAPYRPAEVPAAAPIKQRHLNPTGSRRMRPNLPMAARSRAAAAGVWRLVPAVATTPRSRTDVVTPMLGVCLCNHRRTVALLANCLLLTSCSRQSMSASY